MSGNRLAGIATASDRLSLPVSGLNITAKGFYIVTVSTERSKVSKKLFVK